MAILKMNGGYYALGRYKFITHEVIARLLKYDSCIFDVEITI